MATLDDDTIAAIATASGRAGIGIVRISGSGAGAIAEKIAQKKLLPRVASFSGFYNAENQLIDNGIALYFPGPHSFTGEDVAELQAHGNPILLDQLLNEALRYGARKARPGEFSERAFLNGKIDLAQAEAIADLVAASSATAARSAVLSLQGKFSTNINFLVDALIALRAYIEAAMDFPEEEVDFLSTGKIKDQLTNLKNTLINIFVNAQQGTLITEGMTIVIAGKPNTGKSSLLNALAQRDAAIVTSIAGTTRDVLREHIQLDGMPLHIVDTAGLRESSDPIEQEGMRRARKEMEKADRILLVIDSSDKLSEDFWPENISASLKDTPITIIKNKADLLGLAPCRDGNTITLSAKTGAGIELLTAHLKRCMNFGGDSSDQFSARRRHLIALEKSLEHIETCLKLLTTGKNSELVAEELRLAQLQLEAITGRYTTDDLLEKIFRDFCIGK